MTAQINIPDAFPPVGDVRDKRVVLTGAGRGLGEVIAHAFSRAGAKVMLVARTATDIEAVAAALPGDALTMAGDVADEVFNDAVADAVAAAWGGVDVWICNAGVSPAYGGPLQTSVDDWRRILEVNLTGAFLGARSAARVMTRGGRIIITGSVLGERPRKGLAAYSATKAGVVGMAKSLALDLAGVGITVNVVAPGWFDSPLTEGWMANPKMADQIVGHTAQLRWGDPADLVGAYLYLASDASAFVTGAVISVDGGYLLT